MNNQKSYNVLFLCTGNSARSIFAEAVLNRMDSHHFTGYSAGGHPSGEIHPCTADLRRSPNYKLDHIRSKDWDDFFAEDDPNIDFIVTVCDDAAGEVCPIWPRQTATAHSPFPNPTAFISTEAGHRAFFAKVYGMIEQRIDIFINTPTASLNKLVLKQRLDDIGQDSMVSVKNNNQIKNYGKF